MIQILTVQPGNTDTFSCGKNRPIPIGSLVAHRDFYRNFNQAGLNGHTGKYFQFLNPGQSLLRGEWFGQFACNGDVEFLENLI
jgi:hypothetical protein